MPAKFSLLIALAVGLATPAGGQDAQKASTGQPWTIVDQPQSTLVYARDRTLIGEIGRQLRTNVPLSALPSYVPQAFIAIEDRRFYSHDGVDVVGFLGTLKDALSGRTRGGSTITMQLVGNMHPDVVNRRERTIDRKLREQAAAREMERHYSKQQILEAYLNQLDFGHGWFGIDAAARHYFGVGAGQLTLEQAAMLASLPKSAPIYDPIRHPDRAKARRDLVLTLMARQGYVSSGDAEAAKREPIGTVAGARYGVAPYFVDAVRDEAVRDGVAVMDGGYRVYTPLDPALQRAANAALEAGAAAVETRGGGPAGGDSLQGLVVSVEPMSGEVRALVGGRDYQASPFDRVVNAMRQPGSAFKPIVYAAALSDSMAANAMVYDTALAIPLPNGDVYRPENADGKFLGAITLREALVRSRNEVAVQLGLRVGLDSVIALARRLGLTTPIDAVPATAIGASAVRPIELVAAYTAFDNAGQVVSPRFIARIDDRAGRTVWGAGTVAAMPALDSLVAFIARDMMRDVVDWPEGTAALVRRTLPATVPAAGKTGTTNDNTDVWFVGMTPDLVTAVWLGFDRPRPIAAGAAGGTLAAPIWARIMADYYAGRDASPWVPPAGLDTAEVDKLTGALADSTTPPDRRYVEYFLPGTEPAELRFDPRTLFRDGPISVQ
jgi:penicillin-binding protein 2D